MNLILLEKDYIVLGLLLKISVGAFLVEFGLAEGHLKKKKKKSVFFANKKKKKKKKKKIFLEKKKKKKKKKK